MSKSILSESEICLLKVYAEAISSELSNVCSEPSDMSSILVTIKNYNNKMLNILED